MEQRIGSNNQPLAAAAVDPSHIPGLTAPVSVKKEKKQEEPEDIKPTESVRTTEPEESDESAPEQEAVAAGDEAEADPQDRAEAETQPESGPESPTESQAEADGEDADAGADEREDTADGPVFEAADRRAKIVADSRGVRLRLDDQECEFGWDEIGAIETESPRFGKRFTVTVHTPDRRWYPIEIEAKAKSRHAEWETAIDEVLDAYFEDGDDGDDGEEAEDGAP